MISTALATTHAPYVATTGQTGWRDGCFVLPDKTIGKSPCDLTYWDKSDNKTHETQIGGVAEWLKGLNPPCASSTFLTFAVSVGFAGPLVRWLGRRDGFFFNLAGESSTGKTLASRAARSVIGRADNTGLFNPSAKDRGFEELAFAHNDLTVVLDDLGRLKGSAATRREALRNLAYGLAGGSSMIRSKVVKADLPNLAWTVVGLTSWETPLSELQRAEGEQVRLIDIPIPSRDSGGIFDELKDADSAARRKLADLAQRTVDANCGVALPNFLGHLTNGGEALVAQANRWVDGFVTRARGGENPFLERFAEKFGIVLAAARLAVEAEVAPWTSEWAEAAIERVYYAALGSLITPEEAADQFLHDLRNKVSDPNKFPSVERGEKFPKSRRRAAYGFRRTMPETGVVIAIRRSRLAKLAGSPGRDSLVAELIKRKLLILGTDGKSTKQMLVKGYSAKRRRFYMIPLSGLKRPTSPDH